jgi:hypothetical protein
MPLEVLQRNMILSRFLLMSKDLDMWRIANKAWFHYDTQLSSVIPNFLLLVRLQPVKQNSKDSVSSEALGYVQQLIVTAFLCLLWH